MKKIFLFMALAAMTLTATVFTGCKEDDPDPVKVSSVAFKSTPSASLEVGDTYTFEVTVLPENAENKNVTWDSSDKSVATVSGGVVTTLAAGTTTISATANDGSGKKAEFALTVVDAPVTPTVAITFAEWLSTSAVNEIKYSEALDAEGKPAKELSVIVAATDNIEKITLKLTTDVDLINGALADMGIADGFELGTLPAPIADALAGFFGEGLPTGTDAIVGKPLVKLDFSAILALIVGEDSRIPGGVDQFDIEINAEDANGLKAETKTLKLKFIDDLQVEITGDGLGEEPLEIKKSVAFGATPIPVVVNIEAPQGIENFKVLITSSSPAFTGGLTGLNLTREFDLANPDEALAGTLAGLAAMTPPVVLPNGDTVKGEAELEFNITSFIPMIFGVRMEAGETGDCTADFKLTVTDKKGTTTTKTIKLSLIDDTTAVAEQ